MGGVAFKDWSVLNYLDVNPLPGVFADFQGNPYTYDGHTGHDMGPPNFARMDAGLPLYAAAAGIVEQLDDGYFDRERLAPPGITANGVVINHGSGWRTGYFHFATNTITVKVGDSVMPGQLLGLTGSSGTSQSPHLHFSVTHNGAFVEPYFDPDGYFVNALPYQFSQPTTIADMGITNFLPSLDEAAERPAEQSTFSTSTPQSVHVWFQASYFHNGDQYDVNWYRPDGTLDTTDSRTIDSDSDGPLVTQASFLGSGVWTPYPGTWRVAVEMGGVELGSRDFVVTTGSGTPGIKVAEGTTLISDSRTTAHAFGSAALAGAWISKTFTIENHGTNTLNLSNLALPPGFALKAAFANSVAVGASMPFTVDLDTSRAGEKFGAIQFTTDDPDAATFNFNVSGTVTGAAPAAAPVITLSGPALATPRTAPSA